MTSLRLPARGALRHLAAAGLGLSAALWLAFLRPTSLGGVTTYVFVGGPSMIPTYQVGDLLVAQPRSTYSVGDVVVYHIPAGMPGAGELVVHRVVDGTADSGFTTQGDHNDYTDTWRPRPADIVGVPIGVLPRAGLLIGILRQPLVAASLATLLVLTAFWPSGSRNGRRSTAPAVAPARRRRLNPLVALVVLAAIAAVAGVAAGRAWLPAPAVADPAVGTPAAQQLERATLLPAAPHPAASAAASPAGSVARGPAADTTSPIASGRVGSAAAGSAPAGSAAAGSAAAGSAPAGSAPAGSARHDSPPRSDRYALLVACPSQPDCWAYTVRPGDNLWSIARWFGTPFDAVLARNPQVTNPGHLLAGDVLMLPTPTR